MFWAFDNGKSVLKLTNLQFPFLLSSGWTKLLPSKRKMAQWIMIWCLVIGFYDHTLDIKKVSDSTNRLTRSDVVVLFKNAIICKMPGTISFCNSLNSWWKTLHVNLKTHEGVSVLNNSFGGIRTKMFEQYYFSHQDPPTASWKACFYEIWPFFFLLLTLLLLPFPFFFPFLFPLFSSSSFSSLSFSSFIILLIKQLSLIEGLLLIYARHCTKQSACVIS